MDFQPSAKAEELSGLMWDFLNERVLPAEAEYDAYRASVGPRRLDAAAGGGGAQGRGPGARGCGTCSCPTSAA